MQVLSGVGVYDDDDRRGESSTWSLDFTRMPRGLCCCSKSNPAVVVAVGAGGAVPQLRPESKGSSRRSVVAEGSKRGWSSEPAVFVVVGVVVA